MACAGMSLGAIVLFFLAWAGPASSDRIYIHPFHFLTFNKSSCEELEKTQEEGSPELSFTPVPIQAKSPPVDEKALWIQLASAVENLEKEDRLGALKVGLLINLKGLHMYTKLSKTWKKNYVFSPVAYFGTLASFYLGALEPTASKLQAFLGVPAQDQSCTSRLDGHQIFSILQTIQGFLVSKGNKHDNAQVFLTTIIGLFTAPDLQVKQSFMQGLSPFSPVTFLRSLDLSNPDLAAEKITRFIQAVTGWKMSPPLAGFSPDSTLLFNTLVHFQGVMKGFSLLPEPQEFWVDSNTTVSVPMLSGIGTFQHWNNARYSFSVTRVPLTEHTYLLLIQPKNPSDLKKVEAYTFQPDFLSRKKSVAPRAVHLTMPQLMLEDNYDLQDLLTQARLPTLLDSEAQLGKISDTKPILGKALTSILFELKADGSHQPLEASTQPPETSQKTPEASQQPPEASQKPTEASQQPPEASQKPTEASQKTPEASQQPTEANQQPTEASQQPTEASQSTLKSSQSTLKSSQQPTEATQQPSMPKALEVTLNQPFLFAICEQQTATVHMLGHVINPQHRV